MQSVGSSPWPEPPRRNRHLSSTPHHAHEDVLAILTGTGVVSLGVVLLSEASLMTGGTVGLALLLVHWTGAEFGVLFVAVNIPFFLLSFARLGWVRSARTVVAVGVVSGLSGYTADWIEVGHVHPLYAAAAGGALVGLGLLVLFRHGTTLGGFNILALHAQENWGLRAGYVQLALDTSVLLGSLMIFGGTTFLVSLSATVVINGVIAMNHKPGRYLGAS